MNLELIREKHWTEVTPQEWDFLVAEGILNGCGGRGSFTPPEAVFFRADCVLHDFGYWQGYKVKTVTDYLAACKRKLHCDWKFFLAMLSDSVEVPQKLHLKVFYSCWSIVYFLAVCFLGWKFFQFR